MSLTQENNNPVICRTALGNEVTAMLRTNLPRLGARVATRFQPRDEFDVLLMECPPMVSRPLTPPYRARSLSSGVRQGTR